MNSTSATFFFKAGIIKTGQLNISIDIRCRSDGYSGRRLHPGRQGGDEGDWQGELEENCDQNPVQKEFCGGSLCQTLPPFRSNEYGVPGITRKVD